MASLTPSLECPPAGNLQHPQVKSKSTHRARLIKVPCVVLCILECEVTSGV